MTFFSALLSPSLLSLSPLQIILACLHDTDKLHFCQANKEHHTIRPRMRMVEYHRLTDKDWALCQQRGGPLVTSITLQNLSKLHAIPPDQRGLIKRVRFVEVGSGVSRDILPPLLEELVTCDEDYRETCCSDREEPISNTTLPILPSTLKRLIFGLRMEHPNKAGKMMTQMLAEVTNLTHLGLVVQDASVFSVLPPTIETLALHMMINDLPKENEWPTGLKHLTIEMDTFHVEMDIALAPLRLPNSLVSITFPQVSIYSYYEATLQEMRKSDSLQTIQFGRGIHSVASDLFALLPRGLTQLDDDPFGLRCTHAVQIDSLPETMQALSFPLNNTPFTRWPSSLRVLHIMGEQFSQDISSLPDSVEELVLPQNYTRLVARWPLGLKALDLGRQFYSISSLLHLPPSILELVVPLPLVRRMMSAGTLAKTLPRLIRLTLHGEPDPGIPFDLRLLPSFVVELRFERNIAKLQGEAECPNVISDIGHGTTRDKEADLDINMQLMNDHEMTRYDREDDPEEQLPTLTSQNYEYELEEVSQLDRNQSYQVEFKETRNQVQVLGVIEKLKAATYSSPISGVSLKCVRNPSIIQALTTALNDNAIQGPLALIDCTTASAVPRDAPISVLISKTNDDMMDLMAAIAHSKRITRIKIQTMQHMFDPASKSKERKNGTSSFISSSSKDTSDPFSPPASSSSSSPSPSTFSRVPIRFVAFCQTLTQLSELRTLVFRDCWKINSDMIRLLTRTLLSRECASIEVLDLNDCSRWCEGTATEIAHLITETKTMKYIALANCGITLSGIWQLARSIAVNRSLVSINLAGNRTGVAGLHALRWALRQNRMITITVQGQYDFGESGLDLLSQKRHARLAEERAIPNTA